MRKKKHQTYTVGALINPDIHAMKALGNILNKMSIIIIKSLA